MAFSLTLSAERLLLVLQAVEAHIAAQEARFAREDPSEDSTTDFGNDLRNLKAQRDVLTALYANGALTGADTASDYECWFDPEDNSLSLLKRQAVQACRDRGQLSDAAVLRYAFAAHTGEEAMAIHCLRQGWAPYLPTGDAAPCPKCAATYYQESYGDCWRCGHIG